MTALIQTIPKPISEDGKQSLQDRLKWQELKNYIVDELDEMTVFESKRRQKCLP